MNGTFTQRVIMTITAGFAAACLIWFMRHIVQNSIDSTGANWKGSFENGHATQSYGS
jgi:hypothetical protein